MKPLEQIDKEFTELLLSDPKHWFSQYSESISLTVEPVERMLPISYALYLSFCITYGYEHGVFDLASEKDRLVTYTNEKGKQKTYSERWGWHKDDWKILLPIYKREKEKYDLTLTNKDTIWAI